MQRYDWRIATNQSKDRKAEQRNDLNGEPLQTNPMIEEQSRKMIGMENHCKSKIEKESREKI